MRSVITKGYTKRTPYASSYHPATPPNPGSPYPYAFTSEGDVTLAMDDTTLAATAGVETRVVTSFRSGIPDWKLRKSYRSLAETLGINPDYMLSRIVKAERRAWSRWSNRFPSYDPSPFGRLTT